MTFEFDDDETTLIIKALWDRISLIDRRTDELIKGGMSGSEVYERRHHLSDEVFALMDRIEKEMAES